jgi:hypothetical protein
MHATSIWSLPQQPLLISMHFILVSNVIILPLAEWWVYWNTLVRPSVRSSLNLVYVTSHLSFVGFLLIFGILVGHDLSMHILYRFHGWLMFVRVIALFIFVWPYVRLHILCTQLVICLLSHFIHIWYLDWPWSEHAHITPISWMVDICESYSHFQVCLTIRPSSHLVYATSQLSFVAFYSYLVSWLAMIWACAYYTDFTDG